MAKEFFSDKAGYITANDAAALSGLTRDYVARLCRNKQIQGKLDGNQWYVEPKSLNAFMRAQEEAREIRRAELAKQRSTEYAKAAMAAPAASAAAGALVTPTTQAAMQVAQAAAPALDAAQTATISSSVTQLMANVAPHVTTTIAPATDLLHKIITGGLVVLVALGAFATVNPQAARNTMHVVGDDVGQVFSVLSAPLRMLAQNNASAPSAPAASGFDFATAPSNTPAPAQTIINNTYNNTYNTTNNTTRNTYNNAYSMTGGGVSGPGGVSESELQSKLDALSNSLRFNTTPSGSSGVFSSGGLANEVSLSQNISSLTGTTLNHITVNGVSGLTASDIPALSYLSLGGGTITGPLFSSSTALSVFDGGLKVDTLTVSSTTATSTFANGIALTNGCFSINGTCVAGPGGVTAAGGDQQLQFNNGGFLGGASSITYASTTGFLGIGTTSPQSKLSISSTGSDTSTGLFTVSSSTAGTLFSVDASGLTTFTSAVGTDATTTHFFSSTSSSTNLFSQSAQIGSLTTLQTAMFNNGFLSLASSTITGLANLTGGASTTNLTISNNTWLTGVTPSSLLALDQNGKIVATTSFSVSNLSGILPIANGGTATGTQVTNGVNFFDGTHITSGTALTFDGTNFGVGTSSPSTTFGLVGSQYLTGGLGIGVLNTTAGTLQTSGAATFGGNVGIGTHDLDFGNWTLNSSNWPGTGGFVYSAGGNVTFGISSNGGGTSAQASLQIDGAFIQAEDGKTNTYAGPSQFNNTIAATGLASLSGGATTTNLTVSSNTWLTGVTANSILALDANNKIVATSSFSVGLLSGILPIANGGTATGTQVTNGVNFFDGTRITSQSNFTFDGTTLTTPRGAFSSTSGTTTIASGQGFTIGGTQFVLQQGSGNVGIGTASPGSLLQLKPSSSGGLVVPLTLFNQNSTNFGTAVGLSFIVSNGSTGATQEKGLIAFQRSDVGNGVGDLMFAVNGSNDTTNATIADTKLMIQGSTGNVGIGTTSPYSKLSVWGGATGNIFEAVTSASSTAAYINNSGLFTITNASTTNFSASTASSTIQYARLLNLTATSSSLLATDASGNVIATTSVGVNYLSGILPIANGGTATGTQVTNGVNFFDGTRITSQGNFTFDGTTLTVPRGAFSSTSGTTTIASGQGFTIGTSQFVLQQGSGNVGIGTASPTEKLTLNGTASKIYVADNHDNNKLVFNNGGSTYLMALGTRSSGGTSYLTFGRTVDASTNLTEFMALDSNGNVGIGTTTPGNTFVAQTATAGVNVATLENSNASGYSTLQFNDNTGLLQGVVGYGNASAASPWAGNVYLGSNTTAPVILATNGAERLRITSSGNVGIGTTTPYGKFAISLNNGETYTGNNAFLIASSTSGATSTLFSVANTGLATINSSASTLLNIQSGGTTFVSFDNSADILLKNSSGTTQGQITGNDITNGITFIGQTLRALSLTPSVATFGSGLSIGWAASNDTRTAQDTNISRLSAGVIGFGTGSAASTAGGFLAASSTITGGLFTAAGGASTTNATISGSTWLTGVTANSLLALDANNKVVATSSFSVGLLSGILPIANGGTATSTQVTNGVNFFDGTRITSQGNFTFDGTTLTTPRGAFSSTSGTTTIASGQGFTVGTSQFVVQQTTGNVGIANASPGYALSVGPAAANSTSQLAFTGYNGSTGYPDLIFNNPTQWMAIGMSGSDLTFGVTGSGGTTWATKQVTLQQSTGNLGIGTTTPNFPLDVVNSGTAEITARATSNTSWAGLNIRNDLDSSSHQLQAGYSGSAFSGSIVTGAPTGEAGFLETAGAFPLILATNNTAVQTITSAGNVGIGTSTPFAKFALSLNSTDAAYPGNNAFLIASSTSGATTTLFSVSNAGAATVSTSLAVGTSLLAGTVFTASNTAIDSQHIYQRGANIIGWSSGALDTSPVASLAKFANSVLEFGDGAQNANGGFLAASSTITGGLFTAASGASTTAFTNSGATWLTSPAASSLLALDATGKVIATTSIGTNLLTGI
ncbi:MAG TPA: helix-turn-helix domain-containing protein, partial [Candidatus Paceibacterota bacterium]|nr:helix-turn-helix domain-containing protein [Candidatus Paceibacterota bacterium]